MCTGRAAVPPLNSWLGRNLGSAVLAGTFLLAGCGGDRGAAGTGEAEPLRGVRLVAGTSLDRWALLVVPREGGAPELRDLEDPDAVLWTGNVRLPASRRAHPLSDASVVLEGADGRLHRYDAARDVLSELARIDGDGAWTVAGGRAVWLAASGGSLTVVADGDVWSLRPPESASWAAPVAEDLVAALAGPPEAARLRLLGRDGPMTPTAAPPEVALPAVATAWGRRLVLSGRDGESLVVVDVPELAEAGRVELRRPVVALAASPSSHEVYAAVGHPSRIVAVNRFTGRPRQLARLDEEIRELRPSPLGGLLLARAGERVAVVPLEGGRAVTFESEWRADLPVGLEGGRVLASLGGAVFVWRGEAPGNPQPVSGPADAWWLPVRWRPTRAEVLAEAREGEAEPALAAGEAASVTGREERPAVGPGGEAAADAPGPAERPVAAPPGSPTPEEPPLRAGFYAVVASSQNPQGIRSLTAHLAEAGFPAGVQRHRDEALEVWYRALVGPYETREDAEAAARQLRRERGLQAWISEIGPDLRTEGGAEP